MRRKLSNDGKCVRCGSTECRRVMVVDLASIGAPPWAAPMTGIAFESMREKHHLRRKTQPRGDGLDHVLGGLITNTVYKLQK